MEIPKEGKDISPQQIANKLGFIAKDGSVYKKDSKDGGIVILELRKVDEFFQAWLRVQMSGKGSFWSDKVANYKEPGYEELDHKLERDKGLLEKQSAVILSMVELRYTLIKGAIQKYEHLIHLPNRLDNYDETGRIYFFDRARKKTEVIVIQARGTEIEILAGRSQTKEGMINPDSLRLTTITPEKGNFWGTRNLEKGIAETEKTLDIPSNKT